MVGGGVQVCDVTGVVPPVHTAGVVLITVRVCVPFAWQVPQSEYVNPVHGGVQDCDVTGVPVHPSGVAVYVRLCVPFAWQVPQPEYVYVQVGGGVTPFSATVNFIT